MTSSWNNFSNNATVAASVGACLAAVVSIGSAYMSYTAGARLQDMQNRQQYISEFNAISARFIAEGAKLISAVNHAKPVNQPKKDISTFVAQQMQEAEVIKVPLMLTPADVQYYEDALADFERKTNAVRDANDMENWTISFGHLLDVQRIISQRLSRQPA